MEASSYRRSYQTLPVPRHSRGFSRIINDTWRFEIADATTDGSTVRFTQRNHLIDGEPHPFSGTPCECVISPVADDTDGLMYTLTTSQMPNGERARLGGEELKYRQALSDMECCVDRDGQVFRKRRKQFEASMRIDIDAAAT